MVGTLTLVHRTGWYTASGACANMHSASDTLASTLPLLHALVGTLSLVHWPVHCPWYTCYYTATGAIVGRWYTALVHCTGWYSASGGKSSPAHLLGIEIKRQQILLQPQ